MHGLGLTFHSNQGKNLNRGVDLTAASFATVTEIHMSLFHTGLFLSRGAGPGAGSCFFNVVQKITCMACKLALDINDNVGYSVNDCSFQDLHSSDVGVWHNGTGFRITGYGHHFANLWGGWGARRGLRGVWRVPEVRSLRLGRQSRGGLVL